MIRCTLPLTLLALALAAPARAHAAGGDVELSVTSELTWLLSDSSAVTTGDPLSAAPELRVGWSPVDPVDVYVGWHPLVTLSRDDRGYTFDTCGDALVVGARGRYPLAPWFALAGEVDLEAMHASHTLRLSDTLSGHTDEWIFGAVPKVGVELQVDLGTLSGVLRLMGGYALRTAPELDGVRLPSAAAAVTPLDLGAMDLSGPVFATTFAIRF